MNLSHKLNKNNIVNDIEYFKNKLCAVTAERERKAKPL